MNKTDAAKLAQAYQWLAEGKEVECQLHDRGPWQPWNGESTEWLNFRVKPESEPLLELWVNVASTGMYAYTDKSGALATATSLTQRSAVHMREVRDPEGD